MRQISILLNLVHRGFLKEIARSTLGDRGDPVFYGEITRRISGAVLRLADRRKTRIRQEHISKAGPILVVRPTDVDINCSSQIVERFGGWAGRRSRRGGHAGLRRSSRTDYDPGESKQNSNVLHPGIVQQPWIS